MRPAFPALLLTSLALAFLLSGCASYRSFADVRRAVPQSQLVRLGDQLVHVEQAGQGEPVVLLHGFGASSYSWRKVIPALSASHRVVAIDLNGFGYTERPRDLASYTREGQAALILGVMDALGIDRAHIAGHSYGGGLSLYLASTHSERFRTLILVDSSAPTYPDDRRSRIASVRPLANLFLRAFALRPSTVRRSLKASFFDGSLITPDLVKAYLDRVRIEGAEDAFYGLTVPRRVPTPKVVLDQIRVPTLAVWGAEDHLISLATGRRSVARIPGSEFVVIENCGHMPMEEKPEELLKALLPFLERHRGEPAR
ncbi:MAG TPA: alpha/beta fold hydrolase [Thermoanaerobaculia bacterium]|jgi:pimeloyl-ACP methyl ester carboxylesterase|nr:alpha/beta fold hydrolase [Thermoanaerobaculia bacterium]